MKRVLSLLLAAAFLVLPLATEAATWKIDPNHSAVGFKIRHLFSKVPGSFGKFAGTIDFDPAHPEQGSVEITIDAASIDTGNEKRDKHLRSPDFFEVEKYPEIVFRSTKVTRDDEGKLQVEGVLSMHGVEKPVTLEAEYLGAGPDGWGSTRAGFTASTRLDRKDFGISWNKVLDSGGAMLSDEVEIQIEIEAIQVPEEDGS